ncbi:DUF6262 family protein [Enterocloster citroniae]|uniref:DUF6262 family protein n=1 Tax=Enterocloster citroniae TaxID=358743 RepID=UPI001D088524|nr:DUF6262 family protein [Enterocloster citroniae]MCB7064787.1 DUF6262 family protein [Enterocloster citroniae]
MKRKLPLDQEIYLPEYFNDTVARSFEKESELRILYWDFRKALDEKVKMQIEILLNEIVKSIKNKAERRNGYLLPLKCLFCYAEKSGMRDILKMEQDQEQEYFCMLKEEYGNPCLSPKKFIFFCRKVLFLKAEKINWDANVWFTERLNISSERYSRSNTIESFSFLDIHFNDNRQNLQRYLKYLLTITSLNLGTIRIHYTYVKEFLRFLEDCEKNITDIEHNSVGEYLKRLSMQHISAESYNNKLRVISSFLHYLQVTDCIGEFSNLVPLYYKKSYPVVNEIDHLDQKLDLLTIHLGESPDNLRIMSLILLTTGIKKGQLFLLKKADFYYENENSWMKVPDTIRSIPIPDVLHWLVLKYSDRNHISVENLLFLNNGKKFTAEGFQNAIMKQCRRSGILTDEYVFKGNGYQNEVCKTLYRNGTSIQVIRDYMGYQTDEMVKKHIGLMDEELVKKSMEYYAKMESSLGGNLLMAKYDKMNEKNHQESRRKIERAVEEIRRASSEGKGLSVSELSQNTGLSKGFFYKNEEVKSVLDEEREKRDQGKLAQIKREVCEKSMEKQVVIYQNEIKKLLEENERLKKENIMLTRKVEKLSMK